MSQPAMIVAEEEVAPFVSLSGALLVNVGTLYPERLAAMRLAIAAAGAAGVPWTLDPVAVGLHARFGAMVYTAAELGRRAASAPHTDDRLFTSHLVDTVAAMLSAEPSTETRSLAGQRQARRARRSPSRT